MGAPTCGQRPSELCHVPNKPLRLRELFAGSGPDTSQAAHLAAGDQDADVLGQALVSGGLGTGGRGLLQGDVCMTCAQGVKGCWVVGPAA